MKAEARREATEAVSRAIQGLSDPDFFVVASIYGLGTHREMTVADLARWLVRSPSEIITTRHRAENQIRRTLAG